MKKNISENIPEIYRRKLNGYRCSHRNRWLLLAEHILSIQSLSLFEFYVDISDFDQKHYSYGTFYSSFKKIAQIFCCSPNTIRNWHKELEVQKLIKKTEEKGVYHLILPERYIAPGFWKGEAGSYAKLEKNQPTKNILQMMREEIRPSEQKVNSVKENIALKVEYQSPKALGSSKYPSKVDSSKRKLTEEDKEWLNNLN